MHSDLKNLDNIANTSFLRPSILMPLKRIYIINFVLPKNILYSMQRGSDLL